MTSVGKRIIKAVGSGILGDPLIMWITTTPNNIRRVEKNEQIARECARREGLTQVWIRACDHNTTRISTPGHQGLQLVTADRHITVYGGPDRGLQEGLATLQGDVFLLADGDDNWRVMDDSERTTDGGRGIELHDFLAPGQIYPPPRR